MGPPPRPPTQLGLTNDNPRSPSDDEGDTMTKESVALTPDECWEVLGGQEFGRLAYKLDGQVQLVPINYAVGDRTIIFRTAPGNKLRGILGDEDVAFEIDEIGHAWATSVILRGRARELEGVEARRTEQLPLRPWLNTEKLHVVELTPSEISGFKFRLHRPWRSMMPETVTDTP